MTRTKKNIDELIKTEYGRTRAEWQLLENGKEWDGQLLRKKDIHKNLKLNKSYLLTPYYGGLYPSKLETWGRTVIFIVNEQGSILIPQ